MTARHDPTRRPPPSAEAKKAQQQQQGPGASPLPPARPPASKCTRLYAAGCDRSSVSALTCWLPRPAPQVYIPLDMPQDSERPGVVMIHGCGSSPEKFELESGMNTRAQLAQ